jgi:hypothetical protein
MKMPVPFLRVKIQSGCDVCLSVCESRSDDSLMQIVAIRLYALSPVKFQRKPRDFPLDDSPRKGAECICYFINPAREVSESLSQVIAAS